LAPAAVSDRRAPLDINKKIYKEAAMTDSTNQEANEDLKKLLSGAQLPALPQSAIRLLELAQDPDNGPAEFAVPIEVDPGLTGQVLRFVNSSYFGFSREISSVKLAITLVGVRTIKNFSLWSAVFSLMPNPKCGPLDLKGLWVDSLRRGLFARATGKQMGMKDAEDLFAGALLQDMAVPLLAKELTKDYIELLTRAAAEGVRLSDLEREKYGWTHAEAGGVLARTWNLPAEFATLIERHVDLEQLADDPAAEKGTLAVALSAILPSSADEEWAAATRFETLYRQATGEAAMPLGELLAKIDAEFAEFAPVMKLSAPARSLVDYYNAAVAATG
jgi:HD-like signal output (HDOD) protein